MNKSILILFWLWLILSAEANMRSDTIPKGKNKKQTEDDTRMTRVSFIVTATSICEDVWMVL